MTIYKKTIGLCPACAQDSPAWYDERADGMWLVVDCPGHGRVEERVESDIDFFKWGYEQAYTVPYNHLVVPVTYKCNVKCKYCYSLSNSGLDLPADRSAEELNVFFSAFDGNITLMGGEPTVRDDLPRLIELAKQSPAPRKVSIGTNGQKLVDLDYVKELRDRGLDFVFLSVNDVDYDGRKIRDNKVIALNNCHEARLPVWIQQTIEDVSQLDSLVALLAEYGHTIFSVTIRAVKSYGIRYPEKQVFVSEMLEHLGLKTLSHKGNSPFNRYVKLERKRTKVCSYVNDIAASEPVDSRFVTSDNRRTSLHRGMKVDELLLKGAGVG